MFSYYGSKSNLVDFYPAPKHDKVIEPFAGSARYSLKHFEKDILLVDKYEVIVKIWLWLQQCSVDDILKLPTLKKGDLISDLNLSEPEKLFLGMLNAVSSTSPRNKVSSFASSSNGRKDQLKNISKHLYKIRHWTIRHGSYEDIKNEKATWFIDPPYQYGGSAYVENKMDFKHLAEYCMAREGQVIVCETMKADWLPFNPIKENISWNHRVYIEGIWTNEHTHYNNKQLTIY